MIGPGLLGMKWDNQLYIDLTLPFGLRSAPKIFNSIADALECIVKARGAKLTHHYLDDFIVVGAPMLGECAASLEILLETCKELGIPEAALPHTYLVFLGILIHPQKMEISLHQEGDSSLVCFPCYMSFLSLITISGSIHPLGGPPLVAYICHIMEWHFYPAPTRKAFP